MRLGEGDGHKPLKTGARSGERGWGRLRGGLKLLRPSSCIVPGAAPRPREFNGPGSAPSTPLAGLGHAPAPPLRGVATTAPRLAVALPIVLIARLPRAVSVGYARLELPPFNLPSVSGPVCLGFRCLRRGSLLPPLPPFLSLSENRPPPPPSPILCKGRTVS